MSLNREELNPLGILGVRKLKFIPKHFAKITVSNLTNIKLLDWWIMYNLNSRYAIKKSYMLDSSNRLNEIIEVGVEDPKEILLLNLGCPYIH